MRARRPVRYNPILNNFMMMDWRTLTLGERKSVANIVSQTEVKNLRVTGIKPETSVRLYKALRASGIDSYDKAVNQVVNCRFFVYKNFSEDFLGDVDRLINAILLI